ncbi:cisplatin damage response ATP-dependent DNA ligase [Acidisoma cellulosilytica]|uniref:DNA ligase (ATP) n=1 Tax=Acidisoma cellulosilyticum TaxID=2802395 RepID=A0A963YYB9_9PROT|nr:cisplatin damage response ATP-dependent DNA ligase [Acidisoma cellulosilyticum]MCB8879457.1 cisplatin damage response ATP-dependent DNA ligase [Acidisoma cellulosilyticum]
MTPFADLLERLVFTPGRLAKLALLRDYFTHTPDPDRGYALAAIAGDLSFTAAKPAMIRQIATDRVDPTLFAWSYDYVGDLAETVALIWPGSREGQAPRLSEVVAILSETPKSDLPAVLAGWMDVCDASARLALLKLITGGLRVGASARLAKIALGEMAGVAADDIEEVWHGLAPPYGPLFDWLSGRAAKPDAAGAPVFRPTMLAHPLEEADAAALDWAGYRAEWKWDGIRVQLVATAQGRRLYTRTAEDISHGFPEILAAMDFHGVLDGELLVMRDGEVAPFGDLQQRLNRKSPGPKMLKDFPAGVRLYDILFDGDDDLRGLTFDDRRVRLEDWYARHQPPRMDLSALIPFAGQEDLAALRFGARAASIEGLMLKRGDSPYLAGRPKGPWWKWKRAPLTIDAVLMYAQRGHGRRSSIYSDYTFGLWRKDGMLVPVGKAYSGITDQELAFIDRWVRGHTIARFGPVREVEKSLVLEIAFDAAQTSNRHKSGVALRFPRISRIRTDKPAEEADKLDSLIARIPASGVAKGETLEEEG